MPNIGASGVTYTSPNNTPANGNFLHVNLDGRRHLFHGQLVFGDGTVTYPATGVPLTLSKMGLLNRVEHLDVIYSYADGYVYLYDPTNKSIRIFLPTHETGVYTSRAGTELATSATIPTTTTLEVMGSGW